MHPTPPALGVHPPAYPFAEWLNGTRWTLTRGRDFWGPPHHFVRKIEASARARRVVVFLRYERDGRHIEVQATPRADVPEGTPLVTREVLRG